MSRLAERCDSRRMEMNCATETRIDIMFWVRVLETFDRLYAAISLSHMPFLANLRSSRTVYNSERGRAQELEATASPRNAERKVARNGDRKLNGTHENRKPQDFVFMFDVRDFCRQSL